MVAMSIQILAPGLQGVSATVDRITDSSQGVLIKNMDANLAL
jgi:hypothetical protein